MDTLRFIACGGVDDGKSTLISRLLSESPKRARPIDGTQAEHPTGVDYSFFATPRRRFIAADAPGHEKYTRDMATGASTAQVAVMLIDASKGLQTQTKCHSRILSLLGIRHIILAVNKMDLVAGSQPIFDEIVLDFRRFAEDLGFATIPAVPLSALKGYNVVAPGYAALPWYRGVSLLQWLETVRIDEREAEAPFAMPVQLVNRPNPDFCGLSGRLSSGAVKRGDSVRISPSGVASRVKEIVIGTGTIAAATAGQSVTLVLEDDVDASRGDVIAAAAHPVEAADQFEADLLWMSERPLLPGRPMPLSFIPGLQV